MRGKKPKGAVLVPLVVLPPFCTTKMSEWAAKRAGEYRPRNYVVAFGSISRNGLHPDWRSSRLRHRRRGRVSNGGSSPQREFPHPRRTKLARGNEKSIYESTASKQARQGRFAVNRPLASGSGASPFLHRHQHYTVQNLLWCVPTKLILPIRNTAADSSSRTGKNLHVPSFLRWRSKNGDKYAQ